MSENVKRRSIRLLVATAATLVVPPSAFTQEVTAACAAAHRPARYAREVAPVDSGLPRNALEPLIPMLMYPNVVDIHTGVSVPDPLRDVLSARLDAVAANHQEFLRTALLQILRAGLDGLVPLWAANSAASRYRWESGLADPVLHTLRHQPSDRFLLPLSAIVGDLDDQEEEFVFAVTCDVVSPLLAVRAAARSDSSFAEQRSRLEWISNAERILRHAERLIRGSRAAAVQHLLALVRPSAPPHDSSLFRRKPQ